MSTVSGDPAGLSTPGHSSQSSSASSTPKVARDVVMWASIRTPKPKRCVETKSIVNLKTCDKPLDQESEVKLVEMHNRIYLV